MLRTTDAVRKIPSPLMKVKQSENGSKNRPLPMETNFDLTED